MISYLGNAIKKLRIEKGFTQASLSEDICSIKHLSRIENNTAIASAIILEKLSYKLGHEIFDYIHYSDDPMVYEIKNELDKILVLFDKHQHKDILRIIENTSVFTNDSIHANQLIGWLKGACKHYLKTDSEIDENYYIDLLKISRSFINLIDIFEVNLTPLELKILHSIIIEYYKQKNYNLARILLEKAINLIESNYSSFNYSTYERMIYNLSKLYYQNSEFEAAKQISDKGIQYCIRKNSGTILADLLNINGRALYKLGYEDEGKKKLSNFIALYKIYKPGLETTEIELKITKKYNL